MDTLNNPKEQVEQEAFDFSGILAVLEDAENKEETKPQDNNFYKPSPSLSTSSDGIYRAKIRLLQNPNNKTKSIIKNINYWLSFEGRQRGILSSLSVGDRGCPIFGAWKKKWYSNEDPTYRQNIKNIFQRNESYWVTIQVIEDENQPDLVGKYLIWKLPRTVMDKLVDRMQGENAYPVMDPVIGLSLNLVIKPGPKDPKNPIREKREVSYDMSNFGDYQIFLNEGLYSDEDVEKIDEYLEARLNSLNGKTEKKKEEARQKMESLRDEFKVLYNKGLEAFKGACDIDVDKAMSYKPWDDSTKAFVNDFLNWLDGTKVQETQYTEVLEEQETLNENVVEELPF